MKVPFNDLKAQYRSIQDEVMPQINWVLDNAAYIMGGTVKDFESAFAKAHEVNYCYGLSSGTDGNHLAIWSLGIGPGDEVIIPANTFIASAWGVTLCGATPVFVDCHSQSYNLDPTKVVEAITERTKAILAVHLYGQPADMASLQTIADQHGIYLLEDAAQAHLAEYQGRKVGGIGHISSFSFYPGKNLGAFGEAGAVATNDAEIGLKLEMLRNHGGTEKYRHEVLGHNYRMESIQGAVLKVKLGHLEKWTERRRYIAKIYRELLSNLEDVIVPFEMPDVRHVYHLFVIQVKEQGERDRLQNHLKNRNIETGLHYPIPLHLQPCFKHLSYKQGDFPRAETLADNGLSLPIFPEMVDRQIEYVAEQINSYFH